MPRQNVKDLVIFRAGSYRHGNYTEAMLDEIVSSFNEQAKPAVIIGHSSDYKGHTRIPAFGVINALKRVGKDLVATSAEFSDKLVQWIKEGFYTDRSVEIGKDSRTGKLKLHALGMLGAAVPEVKGMPSMDLSLTEIALEYSESPELVEMSEDASVNGNIDIVEQMGKDDTLKAIRESFALCLSNIENIMAMDSYDYNKLYSELSTCYSDIQGEIGLHMAFLEKMEQMEEKLKGEMSEKKNIISEFFDNFRKSRKEAKEMDAKLEQSYKDEIASLNAKIAEFAEAQRLADEAKAKADAEFAEAEAVKADNALKAEIKQFCEENKLNTKKMEDLKIQDLMFNMAKANTSIEFTEGENKVTKTNLEIFKEITKGIVTAPQGETKEFNEQPKENLTVLEFAEKHYNDHKIEFDGLTKKQAVSKILTDITTGKLKKS
jgi:hypothetical protein